MVDEKFILTRRGYERLRAELAELEGEQAELRDQLESIYRDVDRTNDEEAADFDVRSTKEFVDERIGHLKFVLERAEIRHDDPNPKGVDPGERVTVWNLQAREEQTFNLVDGEEAQYTDNAVSTDSPVGKALLGHAVGDTVEVSVPDGWVRYCIRSIEPIDSAP